MIDHQANDVFFRTSEPADTSQRSKPYVDVKKKYLISQQSLRLINECVSKTLSVGALGEKKALTKNVLEFGMNLIRVTENGYRHSHQ